MESSDESVYHSCPDDSDWDSNDDEHSSPLRRPGSFLGSVSAAPVYADSETARALVCINAARCILAETTKVKSGAATLKRLKGEAILKRILSICVRWTEPDEEISDVLALPIFQSSLALSKSETRSCTLNNINGLISQLRSPSVATVIIGHNDALTISQIPTSTSSLTPSYIVFNPQCRASPDMAGASLRCFPNLSETIRHVYNIISIHRGVDSNAPGHMYAGYVFVPSTVFDTQTELAAIYEANIGTLERTVDIKLSRGRAVSSNAEIASLQEEIEKEFIGERDALARRDRILAETIKLDADLADVHSVTAALLERPESPATPRMTDAILNANEGSEAIRGASNVEDAIQNARTHGKTASLASSVSSQSSRHSEISTPPTSPETLWNSSSTPPEQQVVKAPGTVDNASKTLIDEEASLREAQRLQAEIDAEEASLIFAQKLMQEDVDALAILQGSQAIAGMQRANTKPQNLNDPNFVNLRKRARDAGAAMGICFAESIKAYEEHDGALAKGLSNEGKQRQAEMEDLDKRAADWIYHANNEGSPPNEVDLHGLYVKEAIERVEQAVQRAILRSDSEIHLVVGRGLHSPGGVSKLRPAIEELMAKYQLAARLDPQNAGTLIVQLNEPQQGVGRMDADEIQRLLEQEDEQCVVM